MIPYRHEKIINAVYFFASEHKKKTRKNLYQTYLYKYLAFLDFRSLEETGQPVLALTYRALERGPVPDEIYNNNKYQQTELYSFVNDEMGKIIVPVQKAKKDYDYFSPYEIKLMQNLIDIFAASYVNANLMSEASHQDITGWRRTWKARPNGIIKYIDDFPGDLAHKAEDKLNSIEEHFLIFSGINQIQ